MTECRLCGAPIRWVTSESGARMPVDVIGEYRYVVDSNELAKRVDTYASHLTTCSVHKETARMAAPGPGKNQLLIAYGGEPQVAMDPGFDGDQDWHVRELEPGVTTCS